ncbi:hypothetical protein FRC12_023267 [Ceratobasidium sp. 428]|nr:hypothetical protein FRC12_023267 [Ceratobasidium sp. 428]
MRQLEYPVTRKYTIPHLTAYFSVVSVIAIAFFTTLNVVLQGYDVVTALRPDPNVTQSYWWSTGPLSLRSAGSCNPVSLPKKMNFNTNSSLFTYEVRSAFDTDKHNIAGASSYIANPLSSCTVDAIVLDIDLNRRTFKFDTPIFCTGSDLPFSLSLVSTFLLSQYNPYYDDIMAYYIQNNSTRKSLGVGELRIQRNASSPANVIGILDAVSADLMAAIWLLGNSSTTNAPTAISTGGFLACPGGQNATCEPEGVRMTVPASLVTYSTNGTSILFDGIGPFLAPTERSLINMFTVLQDAYHIDLGNIRPGNSLLDRHAFSTRIYPDDFVSVATRTSGLDFCSSGIGCIQNSTWAEQLLKPDSNLSVTIPSILLTGNAPAAVRVDYLCPQFRLKSPGRLIVSVFIGTWTMYAALFGIFGLVGPALEKIYSRRCAARLRGDEYLNDEHTDAWSLLAQPACDSRRGSSWSARHYQV